MFSQNACPDEMVMDNGPQFISQEFQVFLEEAAVMALPVFAYNPKEDGLVVERWNHTTKGSVLAFTSISWPWGYGIQDLLAQHCQLPI